jgi:hypothetical protein
MPQLLFAQEDLCDPGLKQNKDNPNGYRMRKDRCEGVYIQPVSSITSHQIELVSLTTHFGDYDTKNNISPLIIEWTAPDDAEGGDKVHLRTRALKRKLYYRMDTRQPLAKKSYEWPTNLLWALSIKREDIGVVGWTTLQLVPEELIYLPLRISRKGNPNNAGSCRVVLLLKAKMKEIYVSLSQVDQRGKSVNFLRDDKPLEYGYYPAGKKIEFSLAELSQKGCYKLEIGAETESGGIDNISFYLYHPG